MPVWDRRLASLVLSRAAEGVGHLRQHHALADDEQALWVEIGLCLELGRAPDRFNRTVLFARMAGDGKPLMQTKLNASKLTDDVVAIADPANVHPGLDASLQPRQALSG